MPQQNWKDIVELLGMAAIIASLVFVGYQLKQDREIAVAEAFQARAIASAEGARDLANNENAARAFIVARYAIDPDAALPAGLVTERLEELPAIELLAASLHVLSNIYIWDNSHFQYSRGFLPESHWQRVRSTINESLKNDPVTRFALTLFADQMRPEFRQEVDLIITGLDIEKPGD